VKARTIERQLGRIYIRVNGPWAMATRDIIEKLARHLN